MVHKTGHRTKTCSIANRPLRAPAEESEKLISDLLSYIKLSLILDVLTLAMQHASTIELQYLRLLALLILRFNDSRKFGTCAIPSFVMRFASSQDGVKTRIDAKDRIRYNSPSTSPFPGSAKLTVILTPTLLGIDQVRIRRLKICQFRC